MFQQPLARAATRKRAAPANYSAGSKAAPLALTVVIPAFNEAGNIELLLERIGIALFEVEWEAIFVDDGSKDGTPELIAEIAQRDRRVR